MATQTYNKTVKVQVLPASNFPSVGTAELGELYYDSTNGRLYIRLIDGWKYVTMNT